MPSKADPKASLAGDTKSSWVHSEYQQEHALKPIWKWIGSMSKLL